MAVSQASHSLAAGALGAAGPVSQRVERRWRTLGFAVQPMRSRTAVSLDLVVQGCSHAHAVLWGDLLVAAGQLLLVACPVASPEEASCVPGCLSGGHCCSKHQDGLGTEWRCRSTGQYDLSVAWEAVGRTSPGAAKASNAGRRLSSSNAITPSAHASTAESAVTHESPAALAATTSGAA